MRFGECIDERSFNPALFFENYRFKWHHPVLRLSFQERSGAFLRMCRTVLLIALVVTAIAIIGVGILSQPLPEKLPAFDAIISKSTSNNGTIQITHNGGDTLQKDEVTILVDGQDKTASFSKGGDSSWQSLSPGESLSVQSSNPESVRIVYKGAGASSVLSSAVFGEVPQPTCLLTITASAGTGGSITPKEVTHLCYGNCQIFTITPDSGYHIKEVLVNGISVGAVTPQNLCVPRDSTISATFETEPPTFTSITPSSGPTLGGTDVTIVGTNFVSGGSFGVTIGGTAATSVVRVDSAHITAVTPAGTAGAQNVVITNNDGQTATGTGAYTYVPPPTVTSVVPASGTTAGFTTVTILGTNLVGASAATFD
ncbi:MAG: IPT/TIG domain-containing protein, partial [Methanoregula sp.]|nr:IPT/TIG domain-containing protein [Methanoregula sp.]